MRLPLCLVRVRNLVLRINRHVLKVLMFVEDSAPPRDFVALPPLSVL